MPEDKNFLIKKTETLIGFYRVEIEKCLQLMNENPKNKQYYTEKKRENEELLKEALNRLNELLKD